MPDRGAHQQPDLLTPDAAPLAEIVTRLSEQRGIDFHAYRPAILARRVGSRMRLAGCRSYPEYLELLASHPGEADLLTRHLTIRVSRFFRDRPVWSLLEETVLPDLARQSPGTPLRAWSAGCAYGEEAYTLAMLLERSGLDGARPGSGVYATDVDERALRTARQGCYPESALGEAPRDVVLRYLTCRNDEKEREWFVLPEVRARVLFLRHDLTRQTAPARRSFDLICCRNVLIYFRRPRAERVQRVLVESLKPGGYLCLGASEWLAPDLLSVVEGVEPEARLFRRRPHS